MYGLASESDEVSLTEHLSLVHDAATPTLERKGGCVDGYELVDVVAEIQTSSEGGCAGDVLSLESSHWCDGDFVQDGRCADGDFNTCRCDEQQADG
jgi:hypothetical protein